MPIRRLERRLREVGRIRLGHRRNGNGAPVKGETFRLTSQAQNLIEAAAGIWGGEPRRWDGAPVGVQWELLTDAAELRVVVPPDRSFSQWMETWSGGGCQIRCDTVTNVLNDTPCSNDDPDGECPAGCKHTTRLNVLLPDLPDLGVWRLETHGYYAATELGSTAALLQSATASGRLVEATLRLETREIKRPGQPTMRFPVPALGIPDRLGDFLAPLLGHATAAGELASSAPALEAPQPSPVAEVQGSSRRGRPGSSPHPEATGDNNGDDAIGAFVAIGLTLSAARKLFVAEYGNHDRFKERSLRTLTGDALATAVERAQQCLAKQAPALVEDGDQTQAAEPEPGSEPEPDAPAVLHDRMSAARVAVQGGEGS